MANFAPILLLILGAVSGAIFGAAFDKEPMWLIFWTLFGGTFCGLSQTNSSVGRILNSMVRSLMFSDDPANYTWDPPGGLVIAYTIGGALLIGIIVGLIILWESTSMGDIPKQFYETPLRPLFGAVLGVILYLFKNDVYKWMGRRWSGRNDKFIASVKAGDINLINTLLGKGANVNAKAQGSDFTALMIAAFRGYTEVVKMLLAKGANVNKREKINDVSALMIAAQEGHTEILRTLLSAGADVNARNLEGLSALTFAALHNQTEIVSILLADGADANNRSAKGRTPLMTASEAGHTEVVRLLLANGVDVNAKSHRGDTALGLASKKGHINIVKLINQYT